MKSLTLGECSNDNLTILSKVLYIEELNIEFTCYEEPTNQNEIIINLYTECSKSRVGKLIQLSLVQLKQFDWQSAQQVDEVGFH